ncbi:zinc-binding dehydrogenase [Thalassolituus sp. LLYu03]|uniref:zinc-binding dehydrogenase n=1 Tax=Thalassolituus sp. LLYu03 TaxID=3421656 RepID=UPI003D27A3F1
MATMNALIMQNGELTLTQAAVPEPMAGQVLVRSLACGICGSDLHLTRHTGEVFDLYRKLGVMPPSLDDSTPLMLGHEFCAEIVSYGPETRKQLPVGSRVTSVPILLSEHGAGIGVTPGLTGAYSEYFIVDEALLLPVPDNVPNEAAALAEPLAVGLHAVNRSAIGIHDVALVVGCGPIGLAVIAALKRQGVHDIVAADLHDAKLKTASDMGASNVVNPTRLDEIAVAAGLAGGRRVVIFECVGVHSLIDGFIRRAPAHSTLVITGVHTATSSINYAYATVKEMDIRFSYYYQPEEFAECLQAIADGDIDWRKLLTGRVGIDGASDTFRLLMRPNSHIKIVIEPWRSGALEMIV